MSDYYFDADAQVKLHLSETGSVWVRGLARAAETNGELLHQSVENPRDHPDPND